MKTTNYTIRYFINTRIGELYNIEQRLKKELDFFENVSASDAKIELAKLRYDIAVFNRCRYSTMFTIYTDLTEDTINLDTYDYDENVESIKIIGMRDLIDINCLMKL
jgi:hypothetical protein